MEKIMGFILTFILVIWGIGLVGRWLLRFWLLRKQRQFAEQMQNGANPGSGRRYSNSGNSRKKEGEVTVTVTEESKSVNQSIGEYVDFEEVKE